MNRKPNKHRAGEFISELLDLPADLCGDRLTAELRGRQHLLVCGVRRIAEYTPARIRLSLRDGTVCVEGRDLSVTAYYRGQTGIDGEITAISFPAEERKC